MFREESYAEAKVQLQAHNDALNCLRSALWENEKKIDFGQKFICFLQRERWKKNEHSQLRETTLDHHQC